MEIRIGTSGWNYKHWIGVLYPEGLAQKRWFERYQEVFDTVEINATFYRLPDPKVFEGWRNKARPGFLYAVKVWRVITHRRRLKGVEDAWAQFVERVRLLGHRLGPLLLQLPPGLKQDLPLLRDFLALVPSDLFLAVEFRNTSWYAEEVYTLLRDHGAAFCIHDHPRIPCPRVVTADWTYIRFHGKGRLYSGAYEEADLKEWAAFIRGLSGVRRVFAYFNNDFEGHAVRNALQLRELLG